MKENYKPIIEAVLTAIKAANVNASIGFLPPIGGVAIAVNGGSIDTDMSGNSYINLRFTINAKAQTQVECVQLMDKAHAALHRMDIDGTDWHVYSGRIINAPSVAAEDAQHMWIVTSKANVKAVSMR